MKKKTIEELNSQYYEPVITANKELYAEQRSNSMLVAGNHYASKTAESWSRIRDLRSVPTEQKLRLTKNHIQKITKTYINNLISNSPAVQVIPRDEKSNQSRKAAELNNSVWQYAVDTLDLPIKTLNWASDYVEIGEVAVKCFWNPHFGKVVGMNQKIGDNGEPEVDENGQPVGDEKSLVHEGRLELEHVVATNYGSDPSVSTDEDSGWCWIRKMMPVEKVKTLVGHDPDKLKMVEENKKETTMVFDPATTEYMNTKEQTLVIEYYFKPCGEYPNGYYYITTKSGILFDGELPYGEYPVEYLGFDRIQGNPRHRSIIKQLRPYQLEINRTSSKIAEHQITSDDKVLVQNGTKISTGLNMAGVRLINYSGAKPDIMEGRSGAQYLDYLQQQIAEMYQVAGISEDMEQKPNQAADPMGLLFRSVKDQKKFVIYVEKLEHFLKRVCKLYLRLAKKYLDDAALIPMVGKAEIVNIQEFRDTKDIDTDIKVIPMTDDINTMWGKWLSINHMLQYSSAQLGTQDIAQLAKNLPFGNFAESFSDATLDYDSATNFMLAIERGEQPQPAGTDNKQYMLKKIGNRMRQSDFSYLSPQIQQYYAQVNQVYTQMLAEEQAAIQREQAGFIPTTGPLVRTDLKAEVPNASGGMKTVSKSFPIDALAWLEKQMSAQGASLESLAQLDQSSQARIATQTTNLAQPNVPGQPMAAQPQGVPNGSGSTNPFTRIPAR